VGGSSIRVRLAEGVDVGAAAAIAAGVAGHAPVLAPTGSEFSVSLSDANQAADVLIALRRRNVDITSAAIEQPSLDEVFMALTGHPGATSTAESEVPEA